MKPGCCFIQAASAAHAFNNRGVSSAFTVKMLIRTTGPTSCSICANKVDRGSISTKVGMLSPLCKLIQIRLREPLLYALLPGDLYSIWPEFVAQPENGKNQRWLFDIGFQFLAQACYMDVNRPCEYFCPVAPNLFENFGAGKSLASMCHEISQ